MRKLRLIDPPKVDCGGCRFEPLCVYKHRLMQVLEDNASVFYQDNLSEEIEDPIIIEEITITSCSLYTQS